VRVPLHEAAAAAQARLVNEGALPSQLRFVTDTRTLAAGDVFVALRGERFDGHAYLTEALARGAAALVVDDPSAIPDDAAAFVVRDTRAAYLAFAGIARRHSQARVVAVTGSAGKTTTKTFLAQVLERLAGENAVVATPRNENNEIGVAKVLLGLPEDAAYVVLEFGARHFGEIEPLARAALPEVGVVTNIGEAHLEIFGSLERLAQTKYGIFATGARPVLNAGDATSLRRAQVLDTGVTWFATSEGPRVRNRGDDRTVLMLRTPECDALLVVAAEAEPRENSGMFRTDLRIPGEHNRENVAGAAAAAIALGFPSAAVAASLSGLTLPPGRYERMKLGTLDLIYDAYNASTSGTLATLASFAQEGATRRIAVLGSMAELGDDSVGMHERVGLAAAHANLDALLVGGDFAADIARGAAVGGFPETSIIVYADNAAAVAWLREHTRAGDLVLLKASRRYKLEEIVEGLRGSHAAR
jgi:UDP-N-acetylmuramoyl-tripeptide--D-alanyl-D-alanine ligase